MLKRIAVIGEAELVKSLNQANDDPSVIFGALKEHEHPVSGTCAILAPAGHSRRAIDAAGTISEEQWATLNLLADAVSCRENISLGDAKRVSQYADRFAQALNLSAEDRFCFTRAALLRDVGKIRIHNDLLLKKSVLDYEEWTKLKNHSRLGAELLLERGVCTDVVQIVEYHHECYDGDGYPDHLEREEIPYLARAMRIVDVFCAMTTPRHYRSSHYSVKEALDYLKSERGKHFDPEMANVFIQCGLAEDE